MELSDIKLNSKHYIFDDEEGTFAMCQAIKINENTITFKYVDSYGEWRGLEFEIYKTDLNNPEYFKFGDQS